MPHIVCSFWPIWELNWISRSQKPICKQCGHPIYFWKALLLGKDIFFALKVTKTLSLVQNKLNSSILELQVQKGYGSGRRPDTFIYFLKLNIIFRMRFKGTNLRGQIFFSKICRFKGSKEIKRALKGLLLRGQGL